MRRKVIAGNWKMNMSPDQAKELFTSLIPLVEGIDNIDIVICPPVIHIPIVADLTENNNIDLGTQNIHWEDKGAFTGEISGEMLKFYDVDHAIIGHSERRTYFGETDEFVNKRAMYALNHDIVPIICVGESLEQRETGKTDEFVSGQTKAALSGMTSCQAEKVIIAYEPIWAIGTGKTATAQQADETIAMIRRTVRDMYGKTVSDNIRILYGGSMNEKNADELLSMENIDGGLIGGASLVAEKFFKICKCASDMTKECMNTCGEL